MFDRIVESTKAFQAHMAKIEEWKSMLPVTAGYLTAASAAVFAHCMLPHWEYTATGVASALLSSQLISMSRGVSGPATTSPARVLKGLKIFSKHCMSRAHETASDAAAWVASQWSQASKDGDDRSDGSDTVHVDESLVHKAPAGATEDNNGIYGVLGV